MTKKAAGPTPQSSEIDVLREERAGAPRDQAADGSTSNSPLEPYRKLHVNLDCGSGEHAYSSILVRHGLPPILKPHTAGSPHPATVRIQLRRTVRVPDNRDTNSLPPGLGDFPLFRVRDYADRLPEDMAAKGGLFFPMYQKEAMWLNFSASTPFVIKVYVGGVNAVSGFPMVETEQSKDKRERMLAAAKELREKSKSDSAEVRRKLQDYMVVPKQPWLDGIVAEDGSIKQFVAQPKGSGYSVEAQVTGEEKVGGIQIEVVPVRRHVPTKLSVRFTDAEDRVVTRTIDLTSHGLGPDSTWLDVKAALGREFNVESAGSLALGWYRKPGTVAKGLDATWSSLGFPRLQDSIRLAEAYLPPTGDFTLSASPPPAPIQLSVGGPTRGGGLFQAFSKKSKAKPTSAVGMSAPNSITASYIPGGASYGMAPPPPAPLAASAAVNWTPEKSMFESQSMSLDQECYVASKSAVPESLGFGLADMDISPLAAEKTVAAPKPRLRSARKASEGEARKAAPEPVEMERAREADDSDEEETTARPGSSRPAIKEMGLAAGGSITQTVEPDPYPADLWDVEAAVMFNLQILDSESFRTVTGRYPPPTPVDAAAYAKSGFPFFELWGEEKSGVKGDFAEVKSVAEIDKERAAAAGQVLAEEESVPVRVVTIGVPGRVWKGAYHCSFRPVEQLVKELDSLSL